MKSASSGSQSTACIMSGVENTEPSKNHTGSSLPRRLLRLCLHSWLLDGSSSLFRRSLCSSLLSSGGRPSFTTEGSGGLQVGLNSLILSMSGLSLPLRTRLMRTSRCGTSTGLSRKKRNNYPDEHKRIISRTDACCCPDWLRQASRAAPPSDSHRCQRKH